MRLPPQRLSILSLKEEGFRRTFGNTGTPHYLGGIAVRSDQETCKLEPVSTHRLWAYLLSCRLLDSEMDARHGILRNFEPRHCARSCS